jgi:ferric-dicitrate binding protein FerR (iron transport regulator)
MNRDKYKEKTEQAWDKVVSRLEHDGLLVAQHNRNRTAKIIAWSTAIAAAAVLFFVLLMPAVSRQEKSDDRVAVRHNRSDAATTATTSLVKTLSDASIVFIKGHSTLKCPSHFVDAERRVELDGEALFDVTKDKRRPFIISTRDVMIQVLGTCFNVKNPAGQAFELGVYRGLVKVTEKKNGNEWFVRAGEMLRMEKGSLRMSRLADDSGLTKYKGDFRFKDERLGDIARAINVVNDDAEIRVSDDVSDRRLTVAFANDSPDTMAMLLSEALHLQYHRQGRVIMIE